MVNHFPSEAAAEAHLVSKGFTQHGRKWISRCGLIDARIFVDNFRGDTDLGFPVLHHALCTRRILTMGFVHGAKVLEAPAKVGADAGRLARIGFRTLLKMVFADGFVHADLHPGNMVVQDDDKLVIFDAGMAKLLHEDVLIQFIDVTKCLAMGTPDDLVAHLKRFHTYVGEIDWETLRAEVDAFAKKFRAQDTSKLEYGELIGEMFAIGRKYKVHPVTDMMLVFVALITAQGIGKMLNPKDEIFGAVAQFLMPILMKRNESIPQTAEAKAAASSAAPAA